MPSPHEPEAGELSHILASLVRIEALFTLES
jgi:hypothetical protein